ncbi:MAG: hypothetical protein KatS3mg111_1366 [Pirellulaceae bacterium]|nr:MAG: hypothetical protein KatS3mg111_1366 [Pirellulaceae bacterium]
MPRTPWLPVPWFVCFALSLGATRSCPTAWAQANANGEVTAQVVAFSGVPFGVGRIDLPIAPASAVELPRVAVTGERVFYPAVAFKKGTVPPPPPRLGIGRPGGLLDRLRTRIREAAIEDAPPIGTSIYFLFSGTQPLDVTLRGDVDHQVRVHPTEAAGSQHRELLAGWWEAYVAQAEAAISREDFPTLIHQYLISMLSRRCNLEPVDLVPPRAKQRPEEEAKPLETLELLAAIEPLREKILHDILRNPIDSGRADRELPQPPQWQSSVFTEVLNEDAIEPLAHRTPVDFYYIRFGSFANFLWFRDVSERFGGDVAQAILLRGFNYDSTARIERMLASRMSTVSRMFGGNVVKDMALVGRDLYVKEGPAMGVLFHVSQPALFDRSMRADRQAIADSTPDAVLRDVEIANTKVSFLATPDNRVRSFYVLDGEFALITTSRHMMQRFLAVGRGEPSLASLPSFQAARQWMPPANNYALFAFFSPEFFYSLMSPQYQIELKRRLMAIAHLEVAELASQTALSEGLRGDSVGSLRIAGLVPPWFDQRPDGAKTLRHADTWIDSLRGRRGSFLPIPDVPVTAVTDREAQDYLETASFYEQQWRSMDPLCVGIRRFSTDQPEVESVTVEAHVSPFVPGKYGWLTRQLGAPTSVQIQLPADDVANLQMHIQPKPIIPGLGMPAADYHLFLGLRDMMPPQAEDIQGLLGILQLLRSMPAYVGAWPKPEIVDQLPFGLGEAFARADAQGFSRVIGGLWRWQDAQFSLLSFNRLILEQTIPYLHARPTEDLAQLRLAIKDLSGTQLARWVNNQWYQRAWRASHANAMLLDTLHEQLRVPAAECLQRAERLLDVRLQCPLGGTYRLVPYDGPLPRGGWVSTAWEDVPLDSRGRPIAPADYQAPWIQWYRGGRVHVTQLSNSLSLIGRIDLQLPPLPQEVADAAPIPKLDFDLFSLPAKLFGNSDNAPPEPENSSDQRRKF